MSRGISLVGLNRRQGGDTGDSTPGSCAVGSVNHHDCSPTGRAAVVPCRRGSHQVNCVLRGVALGVFQTPVRRRHAGDLGRSTSVVVGSGGAELDRLHSGPSRQRGVGGSVATVRQYPRSQCAQRHGSWPLTRTKNASAASIVVGCGSGIVRAARAFARRACFWFEAKNTYWRMRLKPRGSTWRKRRPMNSAAGTA